MKQPITVILSEQEAVGIRTLLLESRNSSRTLSEQVTVLQMLHQRIESAQAAAEAEARADGEGE